MCVHWYRTLPSPSPPPLRSYSKCISIENNEKPSVKWNGHNYIRENWNDMQKKHRQQQQQSKDNQKEIIQIEHCCLWKTVQIAHPTQWGMKNDKKVFFKTKQNITRQRYANTKCSSITSLDSTTSANSFFFLFKYI